MIDRVKWIKRANMVFILPLGESLCCNNLIILTRYKEEKNLPRKENKGWGGGKKGRGFEYASIFDK